MDNVLMQVLIGAPMLFVSSAHLTKLDLSAIFASLDGKFSVERQNTNQHEVDLKCHSNFINITIITVNTVSR